MKVKNTEIAHYFEMLADFLEIHAENPYRIKAYRQAARQIKTLPDSLYELVANEIDLTQIPHIGKGIASHIKDIIHAETWPEMKLQSHPKTINELQRIQGLGKKRIKLLQNELNIYTKAELITAIKANKLQKIKGFSKKLEEKIVASLSQPKPHKKLFRLNIVKRKIYYLIEKIKIFSGIENIIVAGDYRRKTELVGKLYLIIQATSGNHVVEEFLALDGIGEILEKNENHCEVIFKSGIAVEVYVIGDKNPTPLLFKLTGSESHFVKLQKQASKLKLNLTEEGLYKNNQRLPITNEQEIYMHLNMDYIEPELREDRGEIEAAINHTLPNLIQLSDIKGDLHSHTNETDGRETLENMLAAAKEKGYEYYAITDHSKRLVITNGLNEERLLKQIRLIDKLNEKLTGFTILKGIEVDILEDGSLDLPDSILKELDVRVCSIHSKFNLPEEKQTERIIRAMDNPYFNILAHPTGRLIPGRPPYPVNIEKIMQAAKERGCFLELNSQPARLDLKDTYCSMAKTLGVKLSISSDAHGLHELGYMQFGVAQARRAWIEADDVINTWPLGKLLKSFKRK